MCIAFFTFGRASGPVFLLAFNRDEYHGSPHILAGRDLEAKGTWLGLSTSGRVAFLTNMRSTEPVEPSSVTPAAKSRGDMPVNFLSSRLSPTAFVQELRASDYHGFNLVLGDLTTLEFVYTHNDITGHMQAQPLEAGVVYGLSNGKLMQWPKVQSGVAMLEELLSGHQGSEEHSLPWEDITSRLLGDNRRLVPPPPEPATFPEALDHITSSRFVDEVDTPYGPYGTRSQTAMAIWRDGTTEVRERYLDVEKQWRQERFTFALSALPVSRAESGS